VSPDITNTEQNIDDNAPVSPEEAVTPPDFRDLGVRDDIASALDSVGITHPFPIQAMTLPVALNGHDIIGQAKTGTGKTLGFAVPTLHRVIAPGQPGWDELELAGRPQALIIAPTRELAGQVAEDLKTAASRTSVRILTVYGGRAYEPQVEALRRGVEIVVGTPGRLLDLAQQGHLHLDQARTVVLDEADEMLDLGFLPDVERLLSLTPAGRQTMLFSATMPGPVVALARQFMTQPTHIRTQDPDDSGATVKATAQFVYRAHGLDKTEMLSRILQTEGRGLTIVFSRTKRTAARVSDELSERGFAAASIHGDLGQGAREQALRAFRKGKIDVLVATDVAARGIDVDDVTHVINYTCPEDEKTYLHRIGRTGRAGNTGTAVTFVDWEDLPRWGLIDKALDLGIPDPTETYSSSDHLYTDLGIPKGVRGTLPRGSRTRVGLDAEEVEDLGETGRSRRVRQPAAGRQKSRSGRTRDDSTTRDGERPSRSRTRQRRRTRGGQLVAVSGQPVDRAERGPDAATLPANRSVETKPADTEKSGRRRRRQRRGGQNRGTEAGTGAKTAGVVPETTSA
jgi:superfamily II DNA/RNA helicase